MKRDSSVKKKKNKQDGSISGGNLIKTLRAVRNTQDQRKKEEDQLYKQYFGSEELKLTSNKQ
jgi:hypothetical protein